MDTLCDSRLVVLLVLGSLAKISGPQWSTESPLSLYPYTGQELVDIES